ncbi:MAG: TolC family protein [Planctomycetota bacterium]|nr:TolC family protein [Planctomycetota bacterium]
MPPRNSVDASLILRLTLLLALAFSQGTALAQGVGLQLSDRDPPPTEEIQPLPAPLSRSVPEPVLEGPRLTPNAQPPTLRSAEPAKTDQVLPINLATALYLSNARPLVIAAAEASEAQAAAQLQNARVLWLPNLNIGLDYYDHSGAEQAVDGTVLFPNKSSFVAGGGATLSLGVTDALFRPLAARQELAARQYDVQAARNDALLAVALAYFDVQYSRGKLAATLDTVAKGEDLVKKISGLAAGLIPEIEVDRARAFVIELRQEVAGARSIWRVSSARLTRVLRLNPSSVVVPLEPPHLQVTLISPEIFVDALVPVGLTNRPELASQRALVDATLERLRQERLRPLIPSVVLQGRGPGGALNAGFFGGGRNAGLETWGGRTDVDLGVVWTLQNLGLGNRTLVRERAAEQQKALIALFNTQDQIAQEVVQAQAQLEAAVTQVGEAEQGVKEALIAFQGTLRGLGQARGAGDLLQLVNRPQEAVAALQQLNRAYENYFRSITAYNQAEFQLYHALGFPARTLAVERPTGEIQPVDTNRPPQMAPVCPHVLTDPCR